MFWLPETHPPTRNLNISDWKYTYTCDRNRRIYLYSEIGTANSLKNTHAPKSECCSDFKNMYCTYFWTLPNCIYFSFKNSFCYRTRIAFLKPFNCLAKELAVTIGQVYYGIWMYPFTRVGISVRFYRYADNRYWFITTDISVLPILAISADTDMPTLPFTKQAVHWGPFIPILIIEIYEF